MSEFNANSVKNRARAAASSALNRAGHKIIAKSQKIVPKKTGSLARSAYVHVSKEGNPSCEVGYSADYAAIVHSKVDFLKGIFESTKSECVKMVGNSVKEAIR